MSIFWHVDNIELLMLAALISSQNASNEVKLLQKKTDSGRPRLVAVVCSLKCFGNYLICWQLISVKATKRLSCLLFKPKPRKCLAVSIFWDLNFLPKPSSDHGYCRRETTW